MNPLDPLLSSGLRLGVMSVLIKLKSASFVYLKNELGSTQGNLSVQLDKLHQSGYIKISKGFKGRYPETNCSITAKGINAFEAHVKNLKNTYTYDHAPFQNNGKSPSVVVVFLLCPGQLRSV